MLSRLLKASISFIIIVLFFLSQSSYASAEVPLSDGFDYPLGAPNGTGYSFNEGLSFLERWDYVRDGIAEYHPGEDWNDDNSSRDYGNNSNDAGDPVYAISDGLITFAKYAEVEWGYLVLIEHKLSDGSRYWSQYAHLSCIESKFLNKINISVKRGEKIGKVGDYYHGSRKNYHLHFEIRKKYRPATAFVMNWSESKVKEYYVNPSEFISSHRPKPPVVAQKLTASITTSGVGLSWDKNTSKEFSKFEIYRSEIADGTGKASSRDLVEAITDQSVVEYMDKTKLSFDKNYYYAIAVFEKDGRSALSNEAHINKKREVINLTQSDTIQKNPKVGVGKVIWEDMTRESTRFPERKSLHYYDIVSGELGEIKIGSDWERVEGPYSPEIIDDWFCYLGKTSRYANPRVFCQNLEQGIDIPITESTVSSTAPALSDNGYVVWSSKNTLYYTNLNGAPEVKAVHESGNIQAGYQTWENLVSWVEKAGDDYKIMVKDLETDELIFVKGGYGNLSFIDISGSWLTWGSNKEIIALNYETLDEVSISNEGSGEPSKISGENIVYETISKGYIYLNVYNISKNESTLIDFPLNWSTNTYIYEDILVFQAPTDPLSESPSSMDIWLTWL